MGRPSKLTDRQWDALGERLLQGDSIRSLAKEFQISEASIRGKGLLARAEEIKSVANQIVNVKKNLGALPIAAQVSAHNLADQLLSISSHLASAANYGAATAHRLSGIAHAKVLEIDDAAPLSDESMKTLQEIAVITKMANSSSEIGIGLLRANKEIVDDINRKTQNPDGDMSVRVSFIEAPVSAG